MDKLPVTIRNYLHSHQVRDPDYWFTDQELTEVTWNTSKYELSFSFDTEGVDLLYTDKEFNTGGDDCEINDENGCKRLVDVFLMLLRQ